MTMQEHEEEVRFQIGGVMLAGTLAMPERALGIVLFADGSGSSRHSPPLRRRDAAQGRARHTAV
jgi:putative phosphoribosyl transferase